LLAGCAAAGVIAWATRVARLRGLRWAPATAIAAMLGAAALLPGTNPAKTLEFLRRSHGVPADARERLGSTVADLRGACAWLTPRLKPGDRVVATDWLTTYCYVGRVDGWIRSREYGWQSILVEGIARDCYIGAQVLPDLPALEAYARRGAVWVVAGAQELYAEDGLVGPEVRRWLLARPAAFVASDGLTRVYRLEPAAAPAPPAAIRGG
jgi:hypothetical protein